jgi:hypothetical protein
MPLFLPRQGRNRANDLSEETVLLKMVEVRQSLAIGGAHDRPLFMGFEQ